MATIDTIDTTDTIATTKLDHPEPVDKQYSEYELETMRDKIEKMDIFYQKHVLSILVNCKTNNEFQTPLSMNENGTYINMSGLPPPILRKLGQYIDYVEKIENTLNGVETQKDECRKLLKK
jgi:hypothetical protein